jgi:hypothetical protein
VPFMMPQQRKTWVTGRRLFRVPTPTRLVLAVSALVLNLLIVCVVPSLFSRGNARAAQARQPSRVRASDIGSEIEILGKLGVPLGQVITVRGRWSSGRFPDTRLSFIVASVNGTPL